MLLYIHMMRHFIETPHYCPLVKEILRSQVHFSHKGPIMRSFYFTLLACTISLLHQQSFCQWFAKPWRDGNGLIMHAKMLYTRYVWGYRQRGYSQSPTFLQHQHYMIQLANVLPVLHGSKGCRIPCLIHTAYRKKPPRPREFSRYSNRYQIPICNVTTRLDNAGTTTPGDYITTSNKGPCLWLNPVFESFSIWDNDTVNSIQLSCIVMYKILDTWQCMWLRIVQM